MSESITLTEREREVFTHMARTLGKGKTGDDIIVSNAILHFLDADFRYRAESAPPPRAPSEHIADAGKMVGVESGPGRPTDDDAVSRDCAAALGKLLHCEKKADDYRKQALKARTSSND